MDKLIENSSNDFEYIFRLSNFTFKIKGNVMYYKMSTYMYEEFIAYTYVCGSDKIRF